MRHGLRHLTGLRFTKEHKDLLTQWSDEQFEGFPIIGGPSPQYWGRAGQVTFTHDGKSATHKGLVVMAGPLRDQRRQSRQERLDALNAELEAQKSHRPTSSAYDQERAAQCQCQAESVQGGSVRRCHRLQDGRG